MRVGLDLRAGKPSSEPEPGTAEYGRANGANASLNVLDLTPVKTARAEEGERVTLIRPRPRARGIFGPIHWLIYWLAPRRLRLDAVGSYCWRRIDGRLSTRSIAGALRDSFGADVEPVEERVGRFFQALRREDLLAFSEIDVAPGPPDSPRQEKR